MGAALAMPFRQESIPSDYGSSAGSGSDDRFLLPTTTRRCFNFLMDFSSGKPNGLPPLFYSNFERGCKATVVSAYQNGLPIDFNAAGKFTGLYAPHLGDLTMGAVLIKSESTSASWDGFGAGEQTSQIALAGIQ